MATVPALTRGLRILEYLATHGAPVGFGDLMAALDLPRATCARLLQVLREEGYVLRAASGGYGLGPALERLMPGGTVRERLAAEAPAVLARLRDATAATAALFQWTGRETVVLDKAMHPQGVVMQSPGNVGVPGPEAPWTAVIHALAPDDVRQALDAAWAASGRDRTELDRMRAALATRGYADDAGTALPGVRRLAAPVIDGDGALVASLAPGGTTHGIPDDRVDAVGAALIEAARTLSRRLGYREPERQSDPDRPECAQQSASQAENP